MKAVNIAINQVTVQYADLVALTIPTVSITGNVIALIGHNGAGKSTFIKTLLGLLEQRTGSFSITDSTGRVLRPEEHLAFCPENGAVFADIAVERYLQLWCRIKHGESSYYRTHGAHYVERLGVAELLCKKGRELSKGQRRRVQTALGFISDPALFLFDEPFDGLDVQRTNDLMEIVEEERGKRAFLISSHRMDVMERLADTIIVLQKGTLASVGSVRHTCQALCTSLPGEPPVNLTDAMRKHLHYLRSDQSRDGPKKTTF
jgi:ABC-2 type transport system ATP-binding protein